MISVIVPVYNEDKAIMNVLKDLVRVLAVFPKYEIIVVNDGSTDRTLDVLKGAAIKDFKIIDHAENLGYGKSLFDGMVSAQYDCILIIDGDGTYPADRIADLYKFYPKYDMVVGARQGAEFKHGLFKRPARLFFQHLVQYACGRKVPDVNSGMRIFSKHIVMKYQDSLCTGFSFTTTITLLFFLNHYYVKYVPIEYGKRLGRSKIKNVKDTLRAGQIIVGAFLYYNPIKLFLLIAFCNVLLGLGLAMVNGFFLKLSILTYTSALCIASFAPIFCIGLIADLLRKIFNINKANKS